MLLTGKPPFTSDTPLEAVRKVIDDEPSRPRLLNPRTDRDLETICLKCIEKDPDRRYASAGVVADDLQRWLDGEPIQARPSTSWERIIKRAKRNPTATALVAVSAVAVVALVGGMFFSLAYRAR